MNVVENYHALTVAILGDCLPETAFDRLKNTNPNIKEIMLDADISLMFQLRNEGSTYKEIGNLYGKKADWVYARMRRNKALV